MSLTQQIFIGFGLAVASPAWAGSGPGNGGDVLVCDQTSSEPGTRLLDFYEGAIHAGLTPELGDDSLTVEQKVEKAISRIKLTAPTQYNRYHSWLVTFLAETRFVSEDLVDIADSGYIWDQIKRPKGCSVVQIAIQTQVNDPLTKRYKINQSLWNALSKDHQAGLIVHEIIYRDALEHEHENSVRARYLTAALASTAMENRSAAEVEQILVAKGFIGYVSIHKPHSYYTTPSTWIYVDIPKTFSEARKFCRESLQSPDFDLAETRKTEFYRVYNGTRTGRYGRDEEIDGPWATAAFFLKDALYQKIVGPSGNDAVWVWTQKGVQRMSDVPYSNVPSLVKLARIDAMEFRDDVDPERKYHFVCGNRFRY